MGHPRRYGVVLDAGSSVCLYAIAYRITKKSANFVFELVGNARSHLPMGRYRLCEKVCNGRGEEATTGD